MRKTGEGKCLSAQHQDEGRMERRGLKLGTWGRGGGAPRRAALLEWGQMFQTVKSSRMASYSLLLTSPLA